MPEYAVSGLKAHGAKRRGRLDIVYLLNVSSSSPTWVLSRRSNRQVGELQEESLKTAILFGSPAWTRLELTKQPNVTSGLRNYPARIAFSTFVVTTSAVVRFAPILR